MNAFNWRDSLESIRHKFDPARPVSRVVRASGNSVVYEGWRARSIAETLEMCAAADGDVWFHRVAKVDARGRSYLGHATKDGAHRRWRQNNPEAARKNSRLQAQRSRERFRLQWQEYAAAYVQKFPGHTPMGFDRFCRYSRRRWLETGAGGIQFFVPGAGMRADIVSAIAAA